MSDERYTPSWIIDGAKAVMGGIDLDPASCAAANERVGAARYYDTDMDGLAQPWAGRVFTNPPYSNCSRWIERLAAEVQNGRVTQVVLLCPIRSLSQIVSRCNFLLRGSLLLPTKRIAYLDPGTGRMISPPFGSLMLYVGPYQLRFNQLFQQHGTVLRPAYRFCLRPASGGYSLLGRSPSKQKTGDST